MKKVLSHHLGNRKPSRLFSCDFGLRSKLPTYPRTYIITLDRNQLDKYWLRASEWVDVMKNIDKATLEEEGTRSKLYNRGIGFQLRIVVMT